MNRNVGPARNPSRQFLDEDRLASHAHGLAQQDHRVVGVVENVDKHHDIEAPITVRNGLAVERRDGEMRVRADEGVDALYPHIRAFLLDKSRD
jgi:hypothetical protein